MQKEKYCSLHLVSLLYDLESLKFEPLNNGLNSSLFKSMKSLKKKINLIEQLQVKLLYGLNASDLSLIRQKMEKRFIDSLEMNGISLVHAVTSQELRKELTLLKKALSSVKTLPFKSEQKEDLLTEMELKERLVNNGLSRKWVLTS